MQITRYCSVNPPEIRLNGTVVFQDQAENSSSFLKSAYRNFHIQYPKFFKMDNLSKLAFLAAEYLLNDMGISERYAPEETGIVFQNGSSSLETDEKHQESIAGRQNYFPSPSVFVYTLPNIMVGEVSIRHKIKGENAVLISPGPDVGQLFDYTGELFLQKRLKCCITGWVEAYHQNLTACLFLVEKKEMAKSFLQPGEMFIFGLSNLERIFNEALQHARIDGKA